MARNVQAAWVCGIEWEHNVPAANGRDIEHSVTIRYRVMSADGSLYREVSKRHMCITDQMLDVSGMAQMHATRLWDWVRLDKIQLSGFDIGAKASDTSATRPRPVAAQPPDRQFAFPPAPGRVPTAREIPTPTDGSSRFIAEEAADASGGIAQHFPPAEGQKRPTVDADAPAVRPGGPTGGD